MHTVRNRKASSPRLPDTRNAGGGYKDKARTSREEIGFMLRASTAQPPAFPTDLFIPAHRGAVITAVTVAPAVAAMTNAQMPKSQVAKSAPAPAPTAAEPSARDAAGEALGTGAESIARPIAKPIGTPGRKAARKAARRAAARARIALTTRECEGVDGDGASRDDGAPLCPSVVAEVAPAVTVEMTTLADRALGLTGLADAADSDHTRSAADRSADPAADAQAATPRTASAPLQPVAPGNPVLPFAPLPTGPLTPLPRNMALAPRRKGFVDVIAFALLDSGRRLARWSSLRRRAEEDREKLRKAEARMYAMEAQLAALQALQERVRQAGG
ncbi:hypothetical protein [Novosphingobium sp. FKTRR1]|uniref:hypothetical protein n=1 Tax=Novosphingobium sp. FKTRR1 TaxID=2879118 RepID=UPI001CF071DB|nr:hypothetical protein [Novosphingobium sp. FKTRR1]